MQKNIRSRCCRKEKNPIFGHRKQKTTSNIKKPLVQRKRRKEETPTPSRTVETHCQNEKKKPPHMLF
jgi:hypothetical protein